MHRLLRRPWIVVIVTLAITLFFAIQLPKTTFDNDVTIFIPENDPEKLAQDEIEEIFGSQNFISVGLRVNHGDIFSTEVIEYIDEVTSAAESLPYVSEAESITNTDYIAGTAEGMEVTPMVSSFTGTEEEIRDIKIKLLSWDMYRRNLFSDDFRSAQVLIRLEKDATIEVWEQAYFDLKDILRSASGHGITAHIAGNPVVAVLMGENMREDLRLLIPFVVVILLLILFLSFRRLGGVFLPMITVSISSIWTMGLMALLGLSLTMLGTVIPILLIAVGSAYAIHIVSHYYDHLRNGSDAEAGDVQAGDKELVFETLDRVGRPVLLAGLTTVAGFGALSATRLLPMRHFGIFTAIGVCVAIITSLTFVPSLLLIQRRRPVRGKARGVRNREGGNRGGFFETLLGVYHGVVMKRKFALLFLLVIIVPLSVFGITRVVMDNAMVDYFKKGTEIKVSDKFLRENYGGTRSFSIMVRGKEKGDLTDPAILKAMDNLAVYLERNFEEVGKVITFADFIKRMNQVMNYDVPEEGDVDAAAGQDSIPGSFFGSDDWEEEFSFEEGDSGFFSGDDGFSEGFSSGEDEDFGSFFTEDFSGTESPDTRPAGKNRGSSLNEVFTYEDFLLLMNRAYANMEDMNMSAEELIRLVNRELNYRGEAYYEVPYDPVRYPVQTRAELKNLISQYLLIYSGSLEDFADDAIEPSAARMMVQMRTTGNSFTKVIYAEIRDYVDRYFPKGYEISMAGYAGIEHSVNNLVIRTQLLSIVISFVIVFLIITVSFKSIVAGFFGIIPLSFAIMINFAVMGYTGIKLDIATAMVASVGIGIGIDYAIHFLSRYRYERGKTDDLTEVTRNTLLTTGKAIMVNALSVGAGFAVLMFSNFNPLVYGGLLVCLIMITSSLASMTVLPVLLNMVKPKFVNRNMRGRKVV